MKIKLLLFTIFSVFSLSLTAQVSTHVLIKFNPGAQEALIANTLGEINGLHQYDKSYHFPRPDVIILPLLSDFDEVKQQLVEKEEITYVAPVYSNSKNQVFTYTDELFVKVKNHHSLNELKKLARVNQTTILGETHFMKDVYKLQVNKNDIDTRELAKKLQETGLFEYAEPNYLFSVVVTNDPDTIAEPNDPLFHRQWNLLNVASTSQSSGIEGADMKVLEAWNITKGSPNIRVAILDSGVDTLHEDLVDNMLPGYDAIGEGLRGYPNPAFDEDGHGTCCAGIVAAVADNGIGIAGVAPQCKIVPVRVFYYLPLGSGGEPIPWSTGEWFADGIYWAWKYGKADVASNSWGIPDYLLDAIDPEREQVALVNDVLETAILSGRNGLGTPYLFSSGNEGLTDKKPIWPARSPITIAVNATSMCDEAKSDTSCDGETWWAGNWGVGVDISAPGVAIPATDMTGGNGFRSNNYYFSFNGTSSACPNAAGVMALILSTNPKIPESEARKIISVTADKVGGYQYEKNDLDYWSKELGYGRVNALAAVQLTAQWDSTYGQGINNYIYHDAGANANYIHFYFSEPTDVTMDIYDIMGKIVKSLPTTSQEGNVNMLINSGELKTGIYILKMKVGNKEATTKFFAYRPQ